MPPLQRQVLHGRQVRSLFFGRLIIYIDAFSSIVVEFAKETRPRRDVYEMDRLARARRPPGFRLVVSGISRDTSWQVRLVFPCPLLYRSSVGATLSNGPVLASCSIATVSSTPGPDSPSRSGSEGLRTRSRQCFLR